jgi:hypothetical protein
MIGKTMTQTAGADDNAAVNAAYNHLNNLLPIANWLYFDADAHPADGSELVKAKGDADQYGAHSLAGILFQAAEDHLLLVLGTFVGMPIPHYGLYTVIRGAIEAAPWCCWLEDPTATTEQRVARALTERVTSIGELNKLGRAAKSRPANRSDATGSGQIRDRRYPHGKKDQDPIAFGESVQR